MSSNSLSGLALCHLDVLIYSILFFLMSNAPAFPQDMDCNIVCVKAAETNG